MVRAFRYSGSKQYFSSIFNSIIENKNSRIYMEPFLGSGSIFINTQKEFDVYYLNDANPHIISIWNFFKEFTYNDLQNINKEILDKFGSIKTSKESYYKFRDFYNAKYFKTNKSERGGYLYFLINSCINSFARFGPNGFNQSFGNCFYFMSSNNFLKIKSKLQRSVLTSLDYRELNYIDDSVVFLDPPYFQRGSSYKGFVESDFFNFLEFFKNKKLHIVYTDMYSANIEKQNGWHPHFLRHMISTAPSSRSEKTKDEYYFTNFRTIKKLF